MTDDRIKELATAQRGPRGELIWPDFPINFARAIEAECRVPEGYVPVPVEPTAFLIEGFDGNGKRVAAVIQQNADNARNSASVFAEHYPSVKTSGLYLAPPDQSAEVERLREELAEAEANYSRMLSKHEAANKCTGQWIDKYDALNLDSGINVTSQAMRIAELERQRDVLAKLLCRYRNETPPGHQPHMIAHEVDAALASVKGNAEVTGVTTGENDAT